jgi:hypothetical protein
MYIVRFNKEALTINIHNLYPGLELTSPVYCSNSTFYISPSQQTDIGITSEASFGIDSKQKDVKGAMLYKLQGKYTNRTDNQLNSRVTSIKNTATNIYLLVALDIKNGWDDFLVCLIECDDDDDDFTWDEVKLWTLRHQYNDRLYKKYYYNQVPWLINDSSVMKIKFDVRYGSDYKLDIFISKGTGAYAMRKPMKIDPKRLVLLPSMMIMLMYMTSLPMQPSFKLDIHNQCLNVNLASPIYINGDGLECHRPPDYKVYAGDTMRSGFMINKLDDESYGVLTYRLQRRQSHGFTETGENTSSATHLLVIWRISRFKKLYADVLLVEHAKAFTWNEDKLNKLYHENHDQLKECNGTISDTLSMDDNMILKTTFSARFLRENSELSVSISEERYEHAIRLFRIDLRR